MYGSPLSEFTTWSTLTYSIIVQSLAQQPQQVHQSEKTVSETRT